jgi:hypothetical protein
VEQPAVDQVSAVKAEGMERMQFNNSMLEQVAKDWIERFSEIEKAFHDQEKNLIYYEIKLLEILTNMGQLCRSCFSGRANTRKAYRNSLKHNASRINTPRPKQLGAAT